MTTASRSYLLEAPEEIRLCIYDALLIPPGGDGLIYDFESGKLRRHDNEPLSLALMRTCKTIAGEMRGLALRRNTVTFKSYYSRELADRLEHWVKLRKFLREARGHMLAGAAHGQALAYDTVLDDIARQFPWFRPTLEASLSETGLGRTWMEGEAAIVVGIIRILFSFPAPTPSARDRAVLYALTTASRAPTFLGDALRVIRGANADARRWSRILHDRAFQPELADPVEVMAFEAHPWTIPDEEDLAALINTLRKTYGSRPRKHKRGPHGVPRPRASAASALIRFLGSLPKETRAQLRKVHLIEDLPAHQEDYAHAQGLIPFCVENPDLRIMRQVPLWNNISCVGRKRWVSWGQAVRRWILEATALPDLGMPAGCFRLLFDCQGVPDQATEAFQEHVHRDAAWVAARARYQDETPGMEAKYMMHWHEFPRVMAEISAGTSSLVKCNFDPGRPLSFLGIYESIRGRTPKEVHDAFVDRNPLHHITRPPLQSRQDMLLQTEDYSDAESYPGNMPMMRFPRAQSPKFNSTWGAELPQWSPRSEPSLSDVESQRRWREENGQVPPPATTTDDKDWSD